MLLCGSASRRKNSQYKVKFQKPWEVSTARPAWIMGSAWERSCGQVFESNPRDPTMQEEGITLESWTWSLIFLYVPLTACYRPP